MQIQLVQRLKKGKTKRHLASETWSRIGTIVIFWKTVEIVVKELNVWQGCARDWTLLKIPL